MGQRIAAAGAAALGVGLFASGVRADDTGTIVVTLDTPVPPGFSTPFRYRLEGQSAFIENVTTGNTSGGQLDNVATPGATLTNPQLFPQPLLTDYLTFAYFGIVATTDSIDTIDRSVVVALDPGVGVGVTLDSLFSNGVQPTDEASVVAALTSSQDSPVFENLFGLIAGSTIGTADITLPQVPRVGGTLNLVAFVDGPNGNLGRVIGTLTDSIVRVVPEPASLGLVGLAVAGLARRRQG